jgi:type VI protein secretion system component VasK
LIGFITSLVALAVLVWWIVPWLQRGDIDNIGKW